MRDLTNILRNSLRLRDIRPVFRKINDRLRAPRRRTEKAKALAWCREETEDVTSYAVELDAESWHEAQSYAAEARLVASPKLAALDAKLGGGGHYPLLYFLVRHSRAKTVVETGVAAGFSSHAILSALEANQEGILWSSDLPYLRLKDPAKYIGCLVDEPTLRARWRLYLEGDALNLIEILRGCGPIDLISYDSDKTYQGRKEAIQRLFPRLSQGGNVLMDDIQDNMFFRDFVERQNLEHHIFEFEGKYVGLAHRVH